MLKKQLMTTVGASLLSLSLASTAQAEIDMEFSAGYDSDYIYRGFNLGDNAAWYGLDASGSCDCGVDWNAGVWGISPDGAGDDELDIYVGVSKTFESITISAGFTAYTYPNGFFDSDNDGQLDDALADEQELYLGISGEFSGFELGATYYQGINQTDWELLELSASYGYDICEKVGLELGVNYGKFFDYYGIEGDYFNASLGLNVAVSESITLGAHLSYSDSSYDFSPIDWDGIYGGVSLAFGF